MSVLVYIEISDNNIKKSSLEAVSYAVDVAKMQSTSVTAVTIGNLGADALSGLGKYGVNKVLHVANDQVAAFSPQVYGECMAQAAKQENASVVVISDTTFGNAIASRLAYKLKAALATNVVSLPSNDGKFVVKRGVYSGKAFAYTELKTATKIINLKKNTHSIVEVGGSAEVSNFSPNLDGSLFNAKVLSTEKATGTILLPEADKVVSAGRGMKGPENWGMIEELANLLGAATACSKPVSDIHWRPHHEHVGQTGITISPNLYIAIGISGAIQHLAGVNSSKVIVVVNKDPEAPFFKAADYGIVGDAFEVLPRLIEAAKSLQN
jgi:electron transfer flavoprotein alpha subunit